ncbi:MAG: tetratricopeptide repeat protein [Thermodesulfobacteriota bacterium]|nr:tetratricopeptide repeat protein [Thermodesulfobacteriota bacterium]
MANSAKIVEEHLSRAKVAFLKGETLKPLLSLAEALKLVLTQKISSMDMPRIGSLLRENFQNMTKMEAVKKIHPAPFIYKKGEEKNLLRALLPVIKKVREEMERESLEAMRQRKTKIDQLIIQGRKYLEKKNILEAQRSFRGAVEEHVDEDAMFTIIADNLITAGYSKEPLEYLKRALERDPDSRKACELAYAAFEKAGDFSAAEGFFENTVKKRGESAHLLLGLGRVQMKLKKFPEAGAAAKKALTLDPGLAMARKIIALAERKT